MKKFVVVGVAGILLGSVLGAMLQQRAIRQRQQPLAVMWLSQYHLQSLQGAITKGDCALAAQSAARLQGMAGELALALPVAVAQDAVFRGYVEKLQSAAVPGAAAPGQCAYDAALLKRVRQACADCHRDYR